MFATLFIYLMWLIGLLGVFGLLYKIIDSGRPKADRVPARIRREDRTRQ
jgi:hypothetical protein